MVYIYSFNRKDIRQTATCNMYHRLAIESKSCKMQLN